jgi:hypothetical protein
VSQEKKNETPPAQSIQLQGRIDQQTAEGIYSNIATIMFNRFEFYVDFGRVVPGKQDVTMHARIITSPGHAKDLARVLAQNIQQYEERFGAIPGEPQDGRKVGF